jgi:hypothetical protein
MRGLLREITLENMVAKSICKQENERRLCCGSVQGLRTWGGALEFAVDTGPSSRRLDNQSQGKKGVSAPEEA